MTPLNERSLVEDSSFTTGLSAERRKVAARFVEYSSKVVGDNARVALQRAGRAIESCCARAEQFSLFDADPAQDKLLHSRCRHRHCPYCHAIDGARVAEILTEIVATELDKGSALAMLTLTVKHTGADSLRGTRVDLDRAWARFTKRQLFKALVAEYHRVGEVERSGRNGWHPHFHLLLKFKAEVHTRELQKLWREGRLDSSPLWRWYKRDCKRSRKAPDATRFVTMTPAMLQDLLREEWHTVTYKVNRPSYVIRLTMIRAGKTPGTALKRWRDNTGKVQRREVGIQKLVKEFCKYITKRQATGRKLGQQGFFDYTPDQLHEYLRGCKNWHMHQSSKGWAAAAEAAEQNDLVLAEAEDAANGCRTIPYPELAEMGMRAVAGALSEEGLHEFERDGLRCLVLLDRDRDLDGQQAIAVRSHLARCYGSDEPVIAFPFTSAQSARIVNRARCKEFPYLLAANRERWLAERVEDRRLAIEADEQCRRRASDERNEGFERQRCLGVFT